MATFNIDIDTRYRKKNGTFPVKVFLRIKRSESSMNTGIDVLESQWDRNLKAIVEHPKAKIFNRIIQQKNAQIEALLLNCFLRGIKIPHAQQFRKLVMSDTLVLPTVLENFSTLPEENRSMEEVIKTTSTKGKKALFIDFFKLCISEIRTESTKVMYQETLDKVEAFVGLKDQLETLTFEDVNYVWLKRFEAYLIDSKLATNSRSIHLRNVRKIFNSAIDEELISQDLYPFRRFKIKTEETKKRSLATADLLNLKNIQEMNCEPHLVQYKDMFMLIFYLVGINIKDLVYLKGIDKGRIEYRRAKTKRLYSIKVEPEAMEIIEKYRGKDYLLNVLDRYKNYKDYTSRMNKNLKHLHPELSTYYARHTWATIASKLDIPKDTIAAALGQGRKTVTDIYIDFDRDKIDKANRMVIDYLKNMSVEDVNNMGIVGDKEIEKMCS